MGGKTNPETRAAYYARNKGKFLADNRRRRERIRAYITERKAGVPCADCGRTFPPRAMDWHHLGDKEFDVCRAVCRGIGLGRLQRELDKCVLLCAVCHRLRD